MRKEHFKGYSFAIYAEEIEKGAYEAPQEETIVSDEKAEDSILSIVYARDERTGLPLGDLTYYVSDKANPAVKQYILDNLMQDVSAAANPAIPDGIDDDLAMDLMRKSTESPDQYAQRLMDYKVSNEKIVKNVISKSPETTVSAE